jgi:hypothetical protein
MNVKNSFNERKERKEGRKGQTEGNHVANDRNGMEEGLELNG